MVGNYNGVAFKEDALKILKKGKKVAIYCGIIHLLNGDPRLAFQKILL